MRLSLFEHLPHNEAHSFTSVPLRARPPGPLPGGVFSVAEALDDLLDWPARLADSLALELRAEVSQ